MKKALTILFGTAFALLRTSASAQQTLYIFDAAGQAVTKTEYVDVQGTPYLSSDWLLGTFSSPSGKIYKDINIKFDQVKDQMFVKGGKGETISLLEPAKDFTLNVPGSEAVINRYFRLGYTNIPGSTTTQYFEVLEDGKTQLLKRSAKIIQENKEYNSATSTKSFEEIIKYYIYKDGKGVIVKKDKKAIFAALGDKQAELESYIKENKLNLKTDADLDKLIAYYNTL